MADTQMTIGNYRTVSLLGLGSFGRVYLAHHVVLNRTVALKLMQATPLNTEQEYAQFLQEARFLEVLQNRFILPILDGGVHEGMPYIVSEYAPNGSLRVRLQQQASALLPLETSLTILSQIGQALHHVHLAEISHRDLKPENILFNAKNDALLADFGLATVIASASMKSVSNAGTPRYMAPEQFRGHVSYASDQYALGCIAYELFTGRPPFQAPDPIALMFMHVSDLPLSPQQLNPTIPDYIDQAIIQALAKQRENRHADIRAFMRALHLPTNEDAYPDQIALAPNSLLVEGTPYQGNIALEIADTPVQQTTPPQLSMPFIEMTGQVYEPVTSPKSLTGKTSRSDAFVEMTGRPYTPLPPEKDVTTSSLKPERKPDRIRILFLIILTIFVIGGSASIFSVVRYSVAIANLHTHATATANAQIFATAHVYSTATANIQAYTSLASSGIMFGFNAQHTHFNPYEQTLSSTNVARLALDWTATTGNSIRSSPTVADGIVYVGSGDGKLYAPLKIKEGKTKAAAKKVHKSLAGVVSPLRCGWRSERKENATQSATQSELRRPQIPISPTDEQAAFLSLDDLIDQGSPLPVPHTPFFPRSDGR